MKVSHIDFDAPVYDYAFFAGIGWYRPRDQSWAARGPKAARARDQYTALRLIRPRTRADY